MLAFNLTHIQNNMATDSKKVTGRGTKVVWDHNRDHGEDVNPIIIGLQQTIGNQGIQTLIGSDASFDFRNIPIQPKLRMSHLDDLYEQEADRVAENVMSIPSSSPELSMQLSNTPIEERLDRKCSACEMKEKEEETYTGLQISRKSTRSNNLQTSEEPAEEINYISTSEGAPLNTATRQFMESRFGYDFSDVRVHTDERSARSAKSVNALAYTIGNDIVFDEGMYMPNTLEGGKLLAHELAHVVQQTGLASADTRRSDLPASPNEYNVHHVASKLGKVPIVELAQVPVQRQRQPDETKPRNVGPPLQELPLPPVCSMIWREDGKLFWKCERIPIIGSTPEIPFNPRDIPEQFKKLIPKEPGSGPSPPFPPTQGADLPQNWLEEVCKLNPMSPLCIPLAGEKSQGQPRPVDSLTKPTGVFWTWDVLFEKDHPSPKESAPNGGMTADGAATLKTIIFFLKGDQTLQVRLIGYTSSEGDTAHNLELSKRRARMVYGKLDEAKLGGQVINPIESDGKAEGCTRLEPGLWACGELRATPNETRSEERKVEVTFLRNQPLPSTWLRFAPLQFGRPQTE